MNTYRKVAEFKTVSDFRTYLQQENIRIGLADAVPGDGTSALARPIDVLGRTLSNRWAILPMEGWDCEDDGRPSELTARRWLRFASSGAKLLYGTEAAAVCHEGRSNPQQLLCADHTADALKEICVQMRQTHRDRFGAQEELCIGLQLTHSGRYSHPNDRFRLESKTAYAHPLLDRKFGSSPANVLSAAEVLDLIPRFVHAAEIAQKAGFDFVDVKMAHGYLLHEFLTAHDRPGPFGGSFENRTRLYREIVEGIRKACGNYPIIVRLSVDECYDRIGQQKGYGLETGVAYAKAIEAMGVDAIDVSSAAYDTFNYWLEPTSFPCGWRKHMAAAVKAAVKIPVLAADVIRTPDFAEGLLAEGVQDFVSLGRPQIADPHWAEKAACGKEDTIKRCISCLYCIESMQENAFTGGHGHCSVNPTVGREREYYTEGLPQNGGGRTVVVVGAGCAGLTAAEILAERGFRVVVIEKEEKAGGQLNLAAMPPHKEKIGWCCRDLLTAAEAKGAEVVFGKEATPEAIAAYNPYADIVATGATAVRPRSIPGADGLNVCTTTEILTGAVKPRGKRVALIGSGMTGLETAELIAQDNELTVVEMADAVAPTTWFQHRDDCIPKLEEAGTRFLLNHKLLSIDSEGIEVVETAGAKQKFRAVGTPRKLPFDLIVLSLGARSERSLAEALEGQYERLYVIGDAAKVGRIADATAAGYRVATELN